MSERQNLWMLYLIPIAACGIIALGMRIRFTSDYFWTLLVNSLYPIIAVTACAVTVIGLKRTSGREWLPSFVALTVFKTLSFGLLCVCTSGGVKLLQSGDGRVAFVLGLAFPALLTLCALLAIFVYAITDLIVKMKPRPQNGVPNESKTRAVLAANVAIVSLGFVLACIIFVAS